MLFKTAVVGAVLAISSATAASVSCPTDLPFSCSNTTVVDDLCCFIAPGGDILLTQFWDTNPSTGPSDSWTIHGLWPDNCDGTYEQYCDESRQYTNITAILRERAPCTLKTMQVYWKDYQGNDESFWEHEFGKHGTCISTLNPECYPSYSATDEVADFFTRAVTLFQTLPTYDWLAAAGIVPSSTQTYTLARIQAVLAAANHHGHDAVVNCSGDELNELWYHFRVKGSVQNGVFQAVDPVGSGSTCPETGIRYLPKYSTPTTTTTTKTTTATPTSTSTTIPTGAPGALSGKGYVKVQPDGFMISTGNWYRAGGTPATYTATPDPNNTTAFTLKTSKGPCQVLDADGSLSCAQGLASSSFGYDGTHLTYGGAATFYAASAPSGQDKGVVFTSEKAVALQMYWQPL
ncbi:ribonuclease t2 [Nemania sp. FL0916]|nr:ribonuclease t2 [Nemania sp. FL0916]